MGRKQSCRSHFRPPQACRNGLPTQLEEYRPSSSGQTTVKVSLPGADPRVVFVVSQPSCFGHISVHGRANISILRSFGYHLAIQSRTWSGLLLCEPRRARITLPILSGCAGGDILPRVARSEGRPVGKEGRS